MYESRFLPGRILVIWFALWGLSLSAYADMGAIYIKNENIHVEESEQKAIILHNGEEEILILGTELKATAKTGIIRFIPFPVEPAVGLAPVDAFDKVAAMIKKYGLVFQTWRQYKGGEHLITTNGVELRFNRKLGAHDLTLIKVNDVAVFRQWVNNYFRQIGLPIKASYPEEESVVADYVRRGISYFVVDYVEVGHEPRFIEPVLYRFKSRKLYYPLKTSNTFGGQGVIDLVIIAPTTLCEAGANEDLFYRDTTGSRALYADGPCLNLPVLASTSARLVREEEDFNKVYPEGEAFFKDAPAFIQVIRYQGKYHFDKDVFVDVRKGLPREYGAREEVSGDMKRRLDGTSP